MSRKGSSLTCNEPHLDDLPADLRGQLTIHTRAGIAEVLAIALLPASAEIGPDRRGHLATAA